MTLQVLILHPVRPGVTPRFTLTPLLHQDGRRPFCGLHSPLEELWCTLWISSLRGCGPEHVFPLLGSSAHGTWFVGMGRFAALPHTWFVGTLQTLGPVYLTVGLRGLTIMPPSLAGLHLCCYGVAPLCPATPMEVVAYTTLPYRPSCGFCTCLLLLSPLHFVLFCKLWRLLIVLGHFCDSSATIKQQQLHCMRAIFLSFYHPCILFYFASCGGYWLFWSTSEILVLPSSSNNCIVCAQSSCHIIALAFCFILQVMAIIDCFGALLRFSCCH